MSITQDIVKELKSYGIKNTDKLLQCLSEIIEYKEKQIEKLNKNQNQKAIECLKELKEKLKMHCDYYFTVDDADGWFLPETKIDLLIDNKIKELEKNNES